MVLCTVPSIRILYQLRLVGFTATYWKITQKDVLPKFYLFCLNLGTRNIRKSIKGSKDSDFSFVYTKN